MEIKILRDVLIEAGELWRYFDGNIPVDLWRAINKKEPKGLFEFVEHAFTFSNGTARPADIKIEVIDGVRWCRVEHAPRGVSTFDKPGIPRGRDWSYIKIPAGVALPLGLAIVKDRHNQKMGATHYTIAPAQDMPLVKFKILLSQLLQRIEKAAG